MAIRIAAGFAGLAMLAGAALWYMAPQPDHAANCATNTDPARCVFRGAPLRIAGSPVFLPPKRQAFFPTEGELTFVDARGTTWRAPPRTLTDGATIPPIFAPLVGDRQSAEYLLAAAMHDAYCGIGNDDVETYHTRPWEDVHRMFYDALVAGGTDPVKARVMFAAVYLGGPRWNDPDRSLDAVPLDLMHQELLWCLRWMLATEPGPDQIIDWMKKREDALRSGTPTEPDWKALGV